MKQLRNSTTEQIESMSIMAESEVGTRQRIGSVTLSTESATDRQDVDNMLATAQELANEVGTWVRVECQEFGIDKTFVPGQPRSFGKQFGWLARR